MDNINEIILRNATVAEAVNMLQLTPVIVEETASLVVVANRINNTGNILTAAVVNHDGCLVGIIPISLLVEDIILKLMPEEYLQEALDSDNVLDFASIHSAKTAKDIMLKPIAVYPQNTLREAFKVIHDNNLSGLPIVDDTNHVVGYLDVIQLIIIWLNHIGTSR